MLSTVPTSEVDRRHAQIAPDDVAKILFTSGSTGTPKGVINTHRMLCSNQQMILQTLPFLGDEPPVLVDWLPWNHTFGGNHNFGIVLYNGGTLYLDEGAADAGRFDESVRNLREVAPTIYFNVPRGYEVLVRALRQDRRARGDVLQPRAAALLCRGRAVAARRRRAAGDRRRGLRRASRPRHRPRRHRDRAVRHLPAVGERAVVGHRPAGAGRRAQAGARAATKLEIRVRGPNVTPGYWRQDDLTRAAFDDEGFYCMGDAARPVEPGDLSKGLVFDGRIKEDFKLSTGTWVSVGPLRARVITHFAPFVQDAVIAGHDRDEVGMLIVPDVDACRALCPDLPAGAPASAVLGHAGVRGRLGALLATFAAGGTGERDETRARPSCSTSRRRSTPAKSPTRGRSTSGRPDRRARARGRPLRRGAAAARDFMRSRLHE